MRQADIYKPDIYKPVEVSGADGTGILVRCYKSLYKFDNLVSFERRKSNEPRDGKDQPLLPPLTTSKPTLVLDLDETLVHTMNCTGAVGLADKNEFWVARRPGVEGFLREMAQSFEVVLWTASEQCYADAVVDILDPHRVIFSHRLYAQDCGGRKDLAKLGRDLERTVLVDDDFAKKIPPHVKRHAMFIAPFYALNNVGDHELDRVANVLRRLIAMKGGWDNYL